MKVNQTGKVYKITSPTGRIYVGSTTQPINARWCYYKRLDCKSQTKLYRSLVKYGAENHIFEIIWTGDVSLTLRNERILGESLNVLDQYKGLNCSLPGYDDVPGIMSELSKEKLRQANHSKKYPQSVKDKVSLTSTGRVMPPRNFEYSEKVRKVHSGKKYPKSAINVKKAYDKQKTPIDMFDIDWNYQQTFGSMREAADAIGGDPANICISCKNGTKVVKNHRFKYSPKSDKRESIMQINHNTNKVIKVWDTISEAVKTLGISRQNITGVCRGRGKTAGGFKWKYVNE